ncbi:hypothetical protein [Afifella sp. YEN Y35]|uniref:hypothetical protein n=1 Tax=Afifella sp. YEN Y35 TaxID=3388337 RepID=UPI0039E14279
MRPSFPIPAVSLLAALSLSFLLAGCLGGLGFGGGAEETVPVEPGTAQKGSNEIDIRRYLGPSYCPDLRIKADTQTLRRYKRGAEESDENLVWQGSLGETARECLYDASGNLTLRIGVSGRVLAGPQGGQATVELPIRIVVVKHDEAVLTSELKKVSVTIGPELSSVFSHVYEVTVPSPGNDRDYIIYVGFDEDSKR